jgi:hypothetical protein
MSSSASEKCVVKSEQVSSIANKTRHLIDRLKGIEEKFSGKWLPADDRTTVITSARPSIRD